MSTAKVVLTDYAWDSLSIEHEILDDLAELTVLQSKNFDELLPYLSDCDALLNTYAGPITAVVMEAMPKCKIIARYGIGIDTIDLDAATAAGIIVTNNPSYCISEVAEHTVALLLSAARKITFYDRRVREGEWDVPAAKPIARVAGKTLGLVGFGNIARNVAVAAQALGMRVLFSDPFVPDRYRGVGPTKVDLPELLAQSDFVSVHAPLTADTRHLIGKSAFGQMKRSAILVNCGRGPLVETEALVTALDTGQIAGCALDTTDPEPLPPQHPLRDRDNVLITPHAAWFSEDAMIALQRGAPGEVRRVLSGEWPLNVVNPAVRGRSRAGL
ncbi:MULTISPECIES: C-terminal binding protein [Paraburkholderia]|uniref:C-terminal binding protein n=1 Tax=Paraburkholderia metrosideri TaxID=580937 RepID=A0ABW9E4L5_9BURK